MNTSGIGVMLFLIGMVIMLTMFFGSLIVLTLCAIRDREWHYASMGGILVLVFLGLTLMVLGI